MNDLGRGDVFYGEDPFTSRTSANDRREAGRPWLIVSDDRNPFQHDQYVCLALTTRTWYDRRVPIPDDAWIVSGTPKRSSVIPWSIASIQAGEIRRYQGTVTEAFADRVAREAVSYLGLER